MQATIKIFLLKSLGDKELVNFDFPQYKSKTHYLVLWEIIYLAFFQLYLVKLN